MAQAEKISQLPSVNNIYPTDILPFVTGMTTIPVTESITFKYLCNNFNINNYTPANSSANGVAGNIAFDSNYLYICTSNNNWSRVSITKW